MIVLFYKTYSIRLITQAQRGFLPFLTVDQGSTQIKILESELGWKAPKDKESRMDCELHCLLNYRQIIETGLSHDGFPLANLVRNGLLPREEALKKERVIRKGLLNECQKMLNKFGCKYPLKHILDLE